MKKYFAFLLLSGLILSCASRLTAAPFVMTGDLSITYAEFIDSAGPYAGGITNTGDTFYTLTVTGGGDIGAGAMDYKPEISGKINLVKAGSGWGRFSTAKTYEGTTTILDGGGIVLADAGTFSSGVVMLNNGYIHSGGSTNGGTRDLPNDIQLGSAGVGGDFYFGWGKLVNVTGNISDMDGQAGKLTINTDSGVTYLNPGAGKALTYTGGTYINNTNAGVCLGGSDILPTVGTVSINGKLDIYGHDTHMNDNWAMTAQGVLVDSASTKGTLTLTNTAEKNFAGSIQNIGKFVKEGTGKLILSGTVTNSITNMTLNAGTLELGKSGDAAIHAVGNLTVAEGTESAPLLVKVTGTSPSQISGTLTLANYNTFDLNGNSQTVADLVSAGTRSGDVPSTSSKLSTVTNTSATAATLTIGQWTGNGVFDGKITGNLNLALKGTGFFYLNNAANDFTGTTTLSGGLTFVPEVGAMSTGTLILDGAKLHNGARTATYSNDIQIANNGGQVMAGWSRNITLTGGISDVAGQSGSLEIFVDSGIVILAPAAGKSNTYSGGTIIGDAGSGSLARLQMGAENALPTSGNVTVNRGTGANSGYLDLHGFNTSIGLLSGDGLVQNAGSAGVKFTLGAGRTAEETATFTGTITGQSDKIITLEKAGAGTQILAGNGSNTFTNLNVTAGMMKLDKSGTDTAVGDVSITGGTLQLTGDSTALVGGTLKLSGGTLDLYGRDLTITADNNGVFPDITGGTLANSREGAENLSVVTVTNDNPNSNSATFNTALSGNLK